MKFYFDTNILLDFLLRRQPYSDAATELFNFSELKEIQLFTSSHCIATAHYISKKTIAEQHLRKLLDKTMDLFKTISVDEVIIRKSLKSHHKDFEDAIQIFCAHQIKGLDGIVTRNLKDFSTSEIDVYSPDEALYFINQKLKN